MDVTIMLAVLVVETGAGDTDKGTVFDTGSSSDAREGEIVHHGGTGGAEYLAMGISVVPVLSDIVSVVVVIVVVPPFISLADSLLTCTEVFGASIGSIS